MKMPVVWLKFCSALNILFCGRGTSIGSWFFRELLGFVHFLVTTEDEFKAIWRLYCAEVRSLGFGDRLSESWIPAPPSNCVTLNKVYLSLAIHGNWFQEPHWYQNSQILYIEWDRTVGTLYHRLCICRFNQLWMWPLQMEDSLYSNSHALVLSLGKWG